MINNVTITMVPTTVHIIHCSINLMLWCLEIWIQVKIIITDHLLHSTNRYCKIISHIVDNVWIMYAHNVWKWLNDIKNLISFFRSLCGQVLDHRHLNVYWNNNAVVIPHREEHKEMKISIHWLSLIAYNLKPYIAADKMILGNKTINNA